MTKLLFIVNVFPPDQLGGASLFGDLAQALSDEGIDVTVRCAYSYYPEWKDKSGENGFRIKKEQVGDVKVERFGLYVPADPNSLKQRLLYEASFMWSLMRSVFSTRKFDVTMVICPLMGAVGFAGVSRFLFRKPLWLNIQDIPAEAAAAGGISSGKAAKWMEKIQNFLFNRADVWSTIAPVMVDRVKELTIRNQPVIYMPNWVHAALLPAIEALPSKVGRRIGGESGKPINLFYSGNIGSKQDLLLFCQKLHESDAKFIFRINGEGAGAEEIKTWLAENPDERFSAGSFLPTEDYIKAIYDADFVVITEKAGSGGSFIPSKMIPSYAAGTPILAISDATTPLGTEMREINPGPWFSWENLDHVTDFLGSVADNQAQLTQWQENAKNRADFYQRKRITQEYARHLKALASDKKAFLRDQESKKAKELL